MVNYQQKIVQLIRQDMMRMRALKAVRSLRLSDCWIAAGFVRNMIWDHLFDTQTSLNDIDVIYFDDNNTTKTIDLALEHKLNSIEPDLPWSVKNQARMHVKNGHGSYLNSKNAMNHWPEKQTAIAVCLDHQGQIHINHCFDLSFQFNRGIDHNPVCSLRVYQKRMSHKNWLQNWPSLLIND